MVEYTAEYLEQCLAQIVKRQKDKNEGLSFEALRIIDMFPEEERQTLRDLYRSLVKDALESFDGNIEEARKYADLNFLSYASIYRLPPEHPLPVTVTAKILAEELLSVADKD